MNADEVREMLRKRLKDATQRAIAEDIGVTEGLLSHVLVGRRPPNGKVLEYLGLEKFVSYRKKLDSDVSGA